MPRPIDNLESAFTEMYEFITDLPSGLDDFESDFDEAFKELENLKVAIAQPGKPLTLNQLRKMDGQPVWVEFIGHPDGTPIEPLWMLVNSREKRLVTDVEYVDWNFEGWFAYSYPPAHIDRSKWISVKERLPDDEKDGETVLAIVSGKPHKNITLCHALMTAGYFPGEGWVVNEYPEWENPIVTHWMPLPEPPEEVQL